MKTPDEIKRALEPCKNKSDCDWCEFAQQCDLEVNALAYIKQLEKMLHESFGRNAPFKEAAYGLAEKYERAMENAKILSDAVTKLERERDFLLNYLANKSWAACDICKHAPISLMVNDCEHIRKVGIPCFEWVGLPEV